MPLCDCLKKPTSLEDLLKHKKVKELKVKTPRSKVNMRIVIKCNSPVVFIVGPPGVGKKRQANAIAKRFGYVHFDVPDLVKVEAMQNTPRGRHIKSILMKSRKFPEFLHLDLLKEAMAQSANRGIKPAAWLVTGFPCLLQEALMFEEEVGRVALLVHLSGDLRLLLRIINRNYHARGVKIPVRLREHLIMFGEHLMPLLAAYDDRVEQVVLVENEDLVFQELFSVMVRFDARKPSNNRPTTLTHKAVERRRRRVRHASAAAPQTPSQEMFLYSPYGPLATGARSVRASAMDDQSLLQDDRSAREEEAATPVLAQLDTRRTASRPSMDQGMLQRMLKSSISDTEDSRNAPATHSKDYVALLDPSQSSASSHKEQIPTHSSLKDPKKASKTTRKNVVIPPSPSDRRK